MNTLLLYRLNSESESLARHFVSDFERQTGKKIDVLEADSREGQQLSSLYDIVDFPAILARGDSGTVLRLWQGKTLPQIGEVSYYV